MMQWRRYVPIIVLLATLLVLSSLVIGAHAQTTELLRQFVFDARADLELVANEAFGGNVRPDGWLGTSDMSSPTVVTDLWFDNEVLANTLFGADVRPSTWIGATAAVADILARNVRHDVELSADEAFGINQRPVEWRGGDPVLRCNRSVQNVIIALDRFYSLETEVAASTFNFCLALAADIEDELTNIYFGTQIEDVPLSDPLDLIVAVRGDLERLADEELGLNNRPANWIGNRDRSSTTLIGDVLLDMQRLADELIGQNLRPDGWIGSAGASPGAASFTLRFDLELLTDEAQGFNVRPNGWQGLLPLARCSPLDQQLIFIAQVQYAYSTAAFDGQSADFCAQASAGANLLVEAPPVLDVVEGEDESPQISNSQIAFTYLDVAATQYMGMMPLETQFRALYRNFNESTMMFVVGEDFAVYIDQRWTNLPSDVFRGLPTLEGVRPIAFCDAEWCQGPGPTPTPTGGGPLIALVIQATPQGGAPPDAAELNVTKTQVSWTNVRVTYLADNAGTRSAQVTLEVCAQPAEVATACEPVTRLFDNGTGTERPVVGQSNGLNIYEMRYGYTTNLLLEGETRFATDVWISDPTIR